MAETAKKIAPFEPEIKPEIQEKLVEMGYERMEGEPLLWWNRFLLYRNLGPKRSLQKAVERERQKAVALKSTGKAGNEEVSPKRARVSKTVHLQEVPKEKGVVVPGSWKAASGQWNWVARARAWDEFIIDMAVNKNYDLLIADYAQKSRRVFVLNELLKAVIKRLNELSAGMTHEQVNFCIARAQSLMHDLRDEMATLDEQWEKGIMRKHMRDSYATQASPEAMEAMRLEAEQRSPGGQNPGGQ